MARIDSYTAITPTTDDYLLGTDSPAGGGPTRNFTVQSIIDLTSESLGDTNDYLDGITVESGYVADSSDAATITFSVGSQTDVILDLGGAAFKAANHYATSTALTNHINDTTQPHSLDSIVGSQTIGPTKLKGITVNGSSGQVLTSDGAGNFAWADDQDDNDNNYLSAVSKPSGSSNDVLFTIAGNGGSNVTATIFGDGAFMSKSEIRTEVKNNLTYTANDFTFLGDVAVVDKITNSLINENAITNSKILDSTISEAKLNISNDPVDGYVLTADGTDGTMAWEANSASNYYLNDITKSGNTLTFDVTGISAGNDPTYTFGDAAFQDFAGSNANTFGTADTVARSDHKHTMSDITDAGGLASLASVGTSEINNNAVTLAKLSPATAGTNGQVLSVNSSNELVWINSSATTIATNRLLPSSVGTASQVLRVNSGATAVEYTGLSVKKDEFDVTNSPSSGKVLGINTNGDMEWVSNSSADVTPGDDTVTTTKLGDEFKTKDATITLSASNQTANLDFRDHAIYEVLTPTDGTNVTIKFNSATTGSTKLLLLKNQGTAGTGTITFATSDTSINGVTFTATRLSSDDIVRTANTTNYIQITCIADSYVDADKRDFIYTVSQAQ